VLSAVAPGWAPASSRIFATESAASSVPLLRMAHPQCSAVQPAPSVKSTSTATRCTSSRTISTCPFSAARCNGLWPIRPLTSVLSWKSHLVGAISLVAPSLNVLTMSFSTRRVSPDLHAAYTSARNSSRLSWTSAMGTLEETLE